MTSCGLSLTPGVSSSKNRNSPALAAGMGASLRLVFSRLVLNAIFPGTVLVDHQSNNIKSGAKTIRVIAVGHSRKRRGLFRTHNVPW